MKNYTVILLACMLISSSTTQLSPAQEDIIISRKDLAAFTVGTLILSVGGIVLWRTLYTNTVDEDIRSEIDDIDESIRKLMIDKQQKETPLLIDEWSSLFVRSYNALISSHTLQPKKHRENIARSMVNNFMTLLSSYRERKRLNAPINKIEKVLSTLGASLIPSNQRRLKNEQTVALVDIWSLEILSWITLNMSIDERTALEAQLETIKTNCLNSF